jgi:hypothetical protein
MKKELIVNHKNKTYAFARSKETWDGNWKKRYPHVKKDDYLDIQAVSLWDHDVVEGIYYTYSLACDGGYFTLWVLGKMSADVIKRAKAMLKHSHDVISLNVIKLKEATS